MRNVRRGGFGPFSSMNRGRDRLGLLKVLRDCEIAAVIGPMAADMASVMD